MKFSHFSVHNKEEDIFDYICTIAPFITVGMYSFASYVY